MNYIISEIHFWFGVYERLPHVAVRLPMTKKCCEGLQSRLKLGAELLKAFRRVRAENVCSCSCGTEARNNMKAVTVGGDRSSQQKTSYCSRVQQE